VSAQSKKDLTGAGHFIIRQITEDVKRYARNYGENPSVLLIDSLRYKMFYMALRDNAEEVGNGANDTLKAIQYYMPDAAGYRGTYCNMNVVVTKAPVRFKVY
jgi:hypothetical protein